jgi:hypothetical protein
MPERFPYFLAFRNVDIKEVNRYKMEFKQPRDLMKLALKFSDAAVVTEEGTDPELLKYAKSIGLPIISYEPGSTRQEKTAKLNALLETL